MIVRERENEFIMIEQDNHAIVSGEIMKKWKGSLFHGQKDRQSVDYAIRYHDYGWRLFDRQPFWNEHEKAPYTFANYPLSPKTVIYTFGIDEVEKHDPYAALLCSRHYSRFLLHDSSTATAAFVEQERMRQEQIIETLGDFDADLFDFHYGMLRLGDDFSLYLCLNDPGVSKENEHYFFQNGIALPKEPGKAGIEKMTLNWSEQHNVSIRPFPFEGKVSVKIIQKVISKEEIMRNGFIKSYEETPYEEVEVDIVPERGL